LASYHFGLRTPTNSIPNADGEASEPEPYAYISYQHDMCSQWPPLDDGSPVPPQVYFHDISVEQVEETHLISRNDEEEEDDGSRDTVTSPHVVFRGNIEWLQDYGTTWQNNERWEYEMHFDSELTCILSGTVYCTSPGSSRREMSRYGTDLVYINAGILHKFESWMNPSGNSGDANHSDNNDTETHNEHRGGGENTNEYALNISAESYQRYAQVSRGLRRRLQMEGASVRTVAMLNQVFTMSQQPGGSDPIDYNNTA
jgi:hypothetical protein